eukprot:TRINITY_DN793_c0_g2_i2.p2 TRINITY_DN793_c0_g2~~TRINITY_DN793_c0_g2_i2.p2  ORF type:complete len:144 (-),score=32.51 TRINITY_DN793_c0_g2_i2:220-651(-)
MLGKILQSVCAVLCVVVFCVSGAKRECESVHPKVGCMAELREYSKGVSGVILVDDDCTFSVNLTYDGTGPDVFWYGALTQEDLDSGVILDDEGLPSSHGPWEEELVVTQLPESVTWDDVNLLSVWCRQFGINFGDADFTECSV